MLWGSMQTSKGDCNSYPHKNQENLNLGLEEKGNRQDKYEGNLNLVKLKSQVKFK